MKLIDVDSNATLEGFLTLKKRLNLYSFYGNVVNKSVVTRMNLRFDKDVGTYLLKSRSDDNAFFKENIPAFSVQRKSRSISVLQKNLVTIIQNISES
jgi:hypothetical protein